jgi:hypothetical protein
MKEGFWGDVYGQTKQAWKQFFEADSQRQRDRYAVREVPAAAEPAATVSQRILRAGFRDPASVAETADHQRHRALLRGSARPMVCFVNVESVDRIIYSIFQRFNLEWKTRTPNLFTQAA